MTVWEHPETKTYIVLGKPELRITPGMLNPLRVRHQYAAHNVLLEVNVATIETKLAFAAMKSRFGMGNDDFYLQLREEYPSLTVELLKVTPQFADDFNEVRPFGASDNDWPLVDKTAEVMYFKDDEEALLFKLRYGGAQYA